jgi:GTP-binding protein EngB required for normal cell division
VNVASPARDVDGSDPEARLLALERLAARAAAVDIARQARELADRVVEGRFYVACVGQFKRGKSTLLNALVGRPILPTGVVPVTSAVTVLRQGAEAAARVRFEDGRSRAIPPEEVGAWVSESENPGNRKGVRAVEVFVPSPLLDRGMCLVDTPGLGSVSGASAAVTRAFVPHLDAALVVVGADPPLSGDELQLVEEVAEQVRHLVFVLNKADRLTEHERQEGTRFAAQVLSKRLRRPIGPILQVSATERLERGEPTREWAALEQAVAALAQEAGAGLVRLAEARGVERLSRALLRELAERRDALARPLEESERRLAVLRKSVAAAELAMADLGVLLAAEQGRLTSDFRGRQEVFHHRARDPAIRELEARVRALDCSRARLRASSYQAAQEVARETVERWRGEIERVAEEMYRRSTDRFVALANEFLARTAASAEPGMEALAAALEPEAGLRAASRLRYTELLHLTSNELAWLLDLLRPRERTARALVARVGQYLDRVLEANSSRVANDLAERVARGRARLEAEVRGALQQVADAARRAIERARARRAEGEEAVRAELALLESLRSETDSLHRTPDEGERT